MDNLDNKTDNKMDNKKTGFLCQNCGKKYKYQSGLCKHRKKCNQIKKQKIKNQKKDQQKKKQTMKKKY